MSQGRKPWERKFVYTLMCIVQSQAVSSKVMPPIIGKCSVCIAERDRGKGQPTILLKFGCFERKSLAVQGIRAAHNYPSRGPFYRQAHPFGRLKKVLGWVRGKRGWCCPIVVFNAPRWQPWDSLSISLVQNLWNLSIPCWNLKSVDWCLGWKLLGLFWVQEGQIRWNSGES